MVDFNRDTAAAIFNIAMLRAVARIIETLDRERERLNRAPPPPE